MLGRVTCGNGPCDPDAHSPNQQPGTGNARTRVSRLEGSPPRTRSRRSACHTRPRSLGRRRCSPGWWSGVVAALFAVGLAALRPVQHRRTDRCWQRSRLGRRQRPCQRRWHLCWRRCRSGRPCGRPPGAGCGEAGDGGAGGGELDGELFELVAQAGVLGGEVAVGDGRWGGDPDGGQALTLSPRSSAFGWAVVNPGSSHLADRSVTRFRHWFNASGQHTLASLMRVLAGVA